ncbi:MAG: hypothetical protein AB7V77_05865 [Candidatus Woesearchaeota archaeon]
MITTEKTLRDLGFKYLFDYGIKPNHYEIFQRKDTGYFFKRTEDNLLEEVEHLRYKSSKTDYTYLHSNITFHEEHQDSMQDIKSLLEIIAEREGLER